MSRSTFLPFVAFMCDGYYTLLSGTAFEKSRQSAATLVLLLRGITKGEPTACLAREIAMSRQNLGPLRKRVMQNLDATAPIELITGTAFEADEVSINAGEKISCMLIRLTRRAAEPTKPKGWARLPTTVRQF